MKMRNKLISYDVKMEGAEWEAVRFQKADQDGGVNFGAIDYGRKEMLCSF